VRQNKKPFDDSADIIFVEYRQGMPLLNPERTA
jgi:hypothetical protein